MKVINLFGGPGSGKSTLRSGLFYQMKISGINCEDVTEYAKDITWEGHFNLLSDQLFILAQQNRKLERLREQIDWVITDSPLLLNLQYAKLDYLPNSFRNLVLELWNSYDNYNVFINRNHEYSGIGRSQNEEEALLINNQLKILLNENNIKFSNVNSHDNAIETILKNYVYEK